MKEHKEGENVPLGCPQSEDCGIVLVAKDETWDLSSIDNEGDLGITPVCDNPSITKVELVGDVSNHVDDDAVSSGLDLAVETIAEVAFPSTASLARSSSTITINKELRACVNVADEKTEAGNVNLFGVVSTKCDRPVNKRHKSILGGVLD